MKTLLQYYRDWLANNWRYRGGEGTRIFNLFRIQPNLFQKYFVYL